MNILSKRFSHAVFWVCTVLAVQGCGNSDLSRQQAKEKIAAGSKFPVEFNVDVPRAIQIASFEGRAVVTDLQKSPLLKVEEAPSLVFPIFSLEFTDAGKKLLKTGGEGRTVRACTVKMGEITGLQFDGNKRKAEVEFELLVEVNDFARFLTPGGDFERACIDAVNSNGQKNNSASIKSKKNMSLFDDGWRVVD